MKNELYVSNTTQSTLSLNCSFMGENNTLIHVFHDIPPARQCFGVKIPRADWDRVKDTAIVKAWVDGGFLIPEKKKITIDQETNKTSEPVPPEELLDSNRVLNEPGAVAVDRVGSRKSKTKLQG